MDEQQFGAIEARWANHPAWTSDGRHHDAADVALLLAEVRRLQAAWLYEKSRADRHEGELSVLRPAVARYATALESIAWSSNTSSLADVARAALAPEPSP